VQEFTVKLTNATIAGIYQRGEPDSTGAHHTFFVVAFSYQKIEWTWNDGGITAMDDWEARVT
jgi:type VI secretion system secreted protein Hcp